MQARLKTVYSESVSEGSFYQPVIGLHSLWVKDGLLTYDCFFVCLFVITPKQRISQHLRTFMYVSICSLLGGLTASTKGGGVEETPAEERDGWQRRRTSFRNSLQFHSMCEPVYHILISLSVILLQLQSATPRVPPSARGCKSSALIKPYVLLTIQGAKKKQTQMTISALLPHLPNKPFVSGLLAERCCRGC